MSRGDRPQSDEIVELAMEIFELGLSDEGFPFVVERDGPRIAYELRRKGSMRARLASLYADRHEDRVPKAQHLTDAMEVLVGRASRSEPLPVHRRVARFDHRVIIDRGDPTGQCFEVDASGWRVLDRSPVLFLRSPLLTAELPLPVSGGSVDELRSLLNVDEAGFRLVVGWCVSFLVPDVQQPVLAMLGAQGSAKSMSAVFIIGVTDPSKAPLSSPPSNPKDWMVQAKESQLVAIDNLSKITDWFSDALCRAVSGDSFRNRELFSDGDPYVVTLRRSLILTAIEVSMRGDLADRCVLLELEPISKSDRRSESEMLAEFEARRPSVFGALLDKVSDVLRYIDDVDLDELPRMADFGRVLGALDIADPSAGYVEAFTSTSRQALVDTVEDDPVAVATYQFAVAEGSWKGTATKLLGLFRKEAPHGLPTAAAQLSRRLKRALPGLRELGVDVRWDREGRDGTRIIHIEYVDASSASSASSAEPSTTAVSTVSADDADDADDVETNLVPGHNHDDPPGATLNELKGQGESMSDLVKRLSESFRMPSGRDE